MYAKTLEEVMPEFAQKHLSLEQSVMVVVDYRDAAKNQSKKLVVLADSTLRELSAKYQMSMFGPVGANMGQPMILVAYVDETTGIVYGHEILDATQFKAMYGVSPADLPR